MNAFEIYILMQFSNYSFLIKDRFSVFINSINLNIIGDLQ
jgi:hypothetical protein